MSPSRTSDDYRHKAANTAESMASAVATAKLAGHLLLSGKAFGPYISVTVRDAEDDGNSIASTFDSVQPPNDESITLRDKVDAALQKATSALADLRIAVREHHLDDIRKAMSDLDDATKDLEKLETIA